jgi:cellulose synthase/poly-beta-1,6-N-acetylglucosamine synthase-like glycosyltransferase
LVDSLSTRLAPANAILNQKMSDFPPVANSFKKAAIQKGIEWSKYEWIITTDADCSRGKEWLSTIAAFILSRQPVLVSAPVSFNYDYSFFQKVQALEFSGLIAIGAACIQNGRPILCNGANLIYKKEAFYAVNGFTGIDGIASGDDEMLMHKIHEQFPAGVHFLKSRAAIVRTSPCLSMAEFIRQRKRWVSKSRKYSNKKITLILSLSYLFNLCILACIIAGLFMPALLVFVPVILALKILTEYMFYRKTLPFFGETALLKWCVPASIAHIFYVLFIGIYGNFGSYKWKGRKVR